MIKVEHLPVFCPSTDGADGFHPSKKEEKNQHVSAPPDNQVNFSEDTKS